MRTTTKYVLLVAALVLAGCVLYVFWAFSAVDASSTGQIQFTVQAGWGGGRIAGELQKSGLIRSTTAFIVLGNLTRTGDKLKAGIYVLSPSMRPAQIESIIASGQALSTDIIVTIPEGMNVWELDELLASKSLIDHGSFARMWQDHEGRLFPDTYHFAKSLTEVSLKYDNDKPIGDVLTNAFSQKAGQFTVDQVIIASILEKEAKTPTDMALVAGIIAKRREMGMPLQIDATVAYGWCLKRWLPMSSNRNCDVTQAPLATEIKMPGDYNTYTQTGLPKGPISNPGLVALNAAAHPQASDYLYYLSTRDGSQIIYAKTLAEHLRNRAKYLGI